MRGPSRLALAAAVVALWGLVALAAARGAVEAVYTSPLWSSRR